MPVPGTSVTSARHSYPYPGTSVSSVRPCHTTRDKGTTLKYLRGTSMSAVRPCHNIRNFFEFCKDWIPVPRKSSGRIQCQYPEFLSSVRPCHNTRGAGPTLLYMPGTSVISVGPCLNTGNFFEFCNTNTHFRNFRKKFHTRTRNLQILQDTTLESPQKVAI